MRDADRPLITVHTDQGALQLSQGSSLAQVVSQLLAANGQEASSVATAVNGQFVARHARTAYILQEGDTVLCFSPITGG